MATVTGSVGGQPVTFTNATQEAAQLATSILAAANLQPVQGSASLTDTFFAVSGTQPGTVTGGAQVTVGILSGQNTVFNTGSSIASQIVAGDNTNSGIINSNANGSLIAFTGAGGNALSGQGLINGFQTGVGGVDQVAFAGSTLPLQVNALTSLGQDTVNIFGANASGSIQVNAITALGTGQDNVTLNNGASLTFVNLSTATSTITAGTGSNVTVGGTGNTLVIDNGSGNEIFTVGTGASSGNVTLVGGTGGGSDTFNFAQLQAGTSTAVDVVANFTSNDRVLLSGYAPNSYSANVVNGSTVVTLSDNTQIVFAGVTDPTQVTTRIG